MTEIELLELIYEGLQVQVALTAFIAGLFLAFYVHLKGLF
jgi:hypothetical protein